MPFVVLIYVVAVVVVVVVVVVVCLFVFLSTFLFFARIEKPIQTRLSFNMHP